MIILLALAITLVALIVAMEAASIAVLGWPALSNKDAAELRELLDDASLNPQDAALISFFPKRGYVSTCGWSLCGTLYYSDYHRYVRIPWWTPLYKEIKAKYAELNSPEK